MHRGHTCSKRYAFKFRAGFILYSVGINPSISENRVVVHIVSFSNTTTIEWPIHEKRGGLVCWSRPIGSRRYVVLPQGMTIYIYWKGQMCTTFIDKHCVVDHDTEMQFAWHLWLFAITLTLVYFVWKRIRFIRGFQQFPGPVALPILGNALMLLGSQAGRWKYVGSFFS